MSEEKEGGNSIKGIIITAVSTVVLGVAGYVTKLITGEKDEAPVATSAPAPVINITNSNQQAQSAGKTVIIKEKAPAAAQPAAAPKKKTEKEALQEEPKW
jgi:hypothetical protein